MADLHWDWLTGALFPLTSVTCAVNVSAATISVGECKAMKKTGLLLVLLLASVSLAQMPRPTVYLEPQQGFETYLAAAITKKGVPVDVVTDQSRATYVLKSAPVEVKSESTGGKIARCMFAYCAGIEDKGNVSVQLIDASSTKMLWAYSVNKQKGGSKNQQSMAEAVAKHFKEFIEKNK